MSRRGPGSLPEGSERRSAAFAHQRALRSAFALIAAVLVVEVAGGLASRSLALLADAGHLLTDVAGLGLTLLAISMARRPASRERTYGSYRLEILAALANAMLLFGVAGAVLVEAAHRLADPPRVASGWMLAVAILALAAALVSARLLHAGHRESLNVRGAYLEVLSDLFGAAAVIVSALVIRTTGLWAADPIASILIAVLILPRTWRLLRESIDVLLEAAPRGMDLDRVRAHIAGAPGVADVHDLHAWTITSGIDVVSAHVVLEPGASPSAVLDHLCGCLAGHFDVEHSTFQLETHDRQRLETVHHA